MQSNIGSTSGNWATIWELEKPNAILLLLFDMAVVVNRRGKHFSRVARRNKHHHCSDHLTMNKALLDRPFLGDADFAAKTPVFA